MLTLCIQAINTRQRIQEYRCVLNQFETALDTVHLIAAAGNVLLEVYILEEGHRTHLPPQAFDGTEVTQPIRVLQTVWETVLSQPVKPAQSLNGLRLLEQTLQRIDEFECRMAEYDDCITQFRSLLLQIGELLGEGPGKQRLLAQYDVHITRYQQSIERVIVQRDKCLERLSMLKQAYLK